MRNSAGFSLVELVIVVAMMTTLVLTAVPTYRKLTLRSHRADAAAALLDLATAQERHYAQHRTYASDLSSPPPAGLGLQGRTPDGRYLLAIAHADVEGFEATATATGAQAPDTHCAVFGLDDSGARSAPNEDCWVR